MISVRRPLCELPESTSPCALELLVVGGVDLPAMAMPFVDDRLAVGVGRPGARHEVAGLRTEAHRSAQVGHVLLLRQQVDHGVRRRRIELARVGAVESHDVAGELDHGALQPEADAEERHTSRSRAYRTAAILPSTPLMPNPPGISTPCDIAERFLGGLPAEVVGGHPPDLHVGPVVEPSVIERLHDRQVGVAQGDVLAHHGDRDRLGRGVDAIDERLPTRRGRARPRCAR